jgi:hypothetical protein
MVHNFITETGKRQAEHASTIITFANKLAKSRNDYFIRIKYQLESISTEKKISTNEVLVDRGSMLHVLQPHDLSRSKLQIDRTNTKNRSMRVIPRQDA